MFRRTLLYAGPPNSSRWYDVAGPGETVGARALVYLRRREGVRAGELRTFVTKQLVPALAGTGVLKELRTQSFLPWIEKLWDTPNVAHDNPRDQRFHASVSLGFTDNTAREAFFAGDAAGKLSDQLAPVVSAIHAYEGHRRPDLRQERRGPPALRAVSGKRAQHDRASAQRASRGPCFPAPQRRTLRPPRPHRASGA